MLQQHRRLFQSLNVLCDWLVVVGSYYLAAFFCTVFGTIDRTNIGLEISGFLFHAVVYATILICLYGAVGVYKPFRKIPFRKKIFGIVLCDIAGLLFIAAYLYVARYENFSRRLLFVFYMTGTLLIVLKHGAVSILLHALRRRGRNLKHIVLIGNGALALQYAKDVSSHKEFGYNILGTISDDELDGIVHLGRFCDIDSILTDTDIDEVVVALEPNRIEEIDSVIAHVEKSGIHCSVIPMFNNNLSSRISVSTIGNSKLITLRDNPLDHSFNAFVKRTEDIIASLLLIVLTSPIMLFAAIGVKLSSPGPVIFKQDRIGKDRKPFKMYKFRSMRMNEESNTAWSKNEDPRKTKFGSLIRKTSIDELPQFFNVLKGDMSLIGPRPEIPHYVEEFKETIPKYMVKHQVRPGITGWAQVNGLRGDTSIEERIKYDIYYIENWSLWFDIMIVFRTVFGGMMNKEKIQ